MIKAFTSVILITACALLVAAQTTHQGQDETQGPSALLTRPALTCDRGDSHPGLSLKITNNGLSNIASGTRIRYSYQLSNASLAGEGSLQLVKPLLPGQSLPVLVDGAKSNSFQACTASLVPVIKLPQILAPRREHLID